LIIHLEKTQKKIRILVVGRFGNLRENNAQIITQDVIVGINIFWFLGYAISFAHSIYHF
jgi:hypothetical protein